ncbi:unnamed protein product [Pleuronectes platessa]|uniref:Uncharacterized protein n=1 Tax=Pleuronectes platessa TaxID=8262 RepID=A0A9N7VNU6_PLEPL|nr:unnamed protein product [Pleuronectes platessa]
MAAGQTRTNDLSDFHHRRSGSHTELIRRRRRSRLHRHRRLWLFGSEEEGRAQEPAGTFRNLEEEPVPSQGVHLGKYHHMQCTTPHLVSGTLLEITQVSPSAPNFAFLYPPCPSSSSSSSSLQESV